MLQKKVSDLSRSKDKNRDDDGIQQKTEIAQEYCLRALHVMRRLLRLLRSGNGRPPARPPVIDFRLVGVDGIVLPVPMTINRQSFACFPSLSRADISL